MGGIRQIWRRTCPEYGRRKGTYGIKVDLRGQRFFSSVHSVYYLQWQAPPFSSLSLPRESVYSCIYLHSIPSLQITTTEQKDKITYALNDLLMSIGQFTSQVIGRFLSHINVRAKVTFRIP